MAQSDQYDSTQDTFIFISVENYFLNVAHHCENICPARYPDTSKSEGVRFLYLAVLLQILIPVGALGLYPGGCGGVAHGNVRAEKISFFLPRSGELMRKNEEK